MSQLPTKRGEQAPPTSPPLAPPSPVPPPTTLLSPISTPPPPTTSLPPISTPSPLLPPSVPSADASAETAKLGKRAASESPPSTPPPKYKRLRQRRELHAASGSSPVKAASGDTLLLIRDKINEIIEGRTTLEQLGEWENAWQDLCDLLDERDELAVQQKQLLREIGILTANCERLEARIRVVTRHGA